MTYNEIREQLGEEEIAMVSMEFWMTHEYPEPLDSTIHDKPDHPLWRELKAYQMGWLACKTHYKTNE